MIRHAKLNIYIVRIVALLTALMLFVSVIAAVGITWPEAPGDVVHKNSGLLVDASNADEGYICVKYSSSSKRLKARVSSGDANYTYDLNGNGEYEVFPLQMGSGSYGVRVYEQVRGNEYAVIASLSFRVSLENENAAFLCPSQYVWYDPESPAVIKAGELCANASSNAERAQLVFDFITRHWVYDFMLALTVKSGYLPNIDNTYNSKRGICFDFAALMACMLRSQGVPVKLVIGDANGNYHAWNEVLIDGEWVRFDPTDKITGSRYNSYVDERIY